MITFATKVMTSLTFARYSFENKLNEDYGIQSFNIFIARMIYQLSANFATNLLENAILKAGTIQMIVMLSIFATWKILTI